MQKLKRILLIAFSLLIACGHAHSSRLDSLNSLLKSSEADTVKLNLYSEIYYELIYTKREEALKCAINGLELSKQLKSPYHIAKQIMLIGYYYNLNSQYDQALKYYLQSLRIFEKVQNKKKIANTLLNIGIVFSNKGKYTDAIRYYQKALAITEDFGDKIGTGDLYINIGNIHREQNNIDKSIAYYHLAKTSYESVNYTHGLASAYNNLGIILGMKNELDSAIIYFKKSLEIKKQLGLEHELSNTYGNIGLCYFELGRYRIALDFYYKTLELEKKYKNEREQAGSYISIGEAFIELNNYKKAIEALKEAKLLAEKTDNKYYLQYAYEKMAIAYERMGDHKNAHESHKIYTALKDSILNEEKSRQITEIETKYTTQKKEKEIGLLNRQLEGKKKIIGYSVVGGVLVIAALIYILLRAYRLRLINENIKIANLHLEEKHRYFLQSLNYFIPSNEDENTSDMIQSEVAIENEGFEKKNILDESPVYNEQIIEFVAENEKDKLKIKIQELLYIESADNYSTICYSENGNTKNHLIRSSLKRIEQQIHNDSIMRCHRTFIVNLNNVKKIEGNAAGYKLTLNFGEIQVPVSRSFGTIIVEKLKNLLAQY